MIFFIDCSYYMFIIVIITVIVIQAFDGRKNMVWMDLRQTPVTTGICCSLSQYVLFAILSLTDQNETTNHDLGEEFLLRFFKNIGYRLTPTDSFWSSLLVPGRNREKGKYRTYTT